MLNYAVGVHNGSNDPYAAQKMAKRHYKSFYGIYPKRERGQKSSSLSIDPDVRHIMQSQMGGQFSKAYDWKRKNFT